MPQLAYQSMGSPWPLTGNEAAAMHLRRGLEVCGVSKAPKGAKCNSEDILCTGLYVCRDRDNMKPLMVVLRFH